MNTPNFKHWLDKRTNNLTEAWYDWLFKNKKSNTSDPQDINKAIYNNLSVKKYVDVIIKHMGLEPGANLKEIDANGMEIKDIAVTNVATQFANFYAALQRFVAGHVIGGGEEVSYLRISQHDALIIFNTLDHLQREGSKKSIAEEMGISDIESLVNWIQTKVPTAPNAVYQKGFSQSNIDLLGQRIARGKGNPLNHPAVKGLVNAGQETVRQGLRKKHYTKGLQDALVNLDVELAKITGKEVVPLEPKQRANASKTGTPGKGYPI